MLKQLGRDVAKAIVDKYGSFSEASKQSGIHRTTYTRLRTAPTWSNIGNMIEVHNLDVRFCVGEFDVPTENNRMDINPEVADYIVNRVDAMLDEKYSLQRKRNKKKQASNDDEWLSLFN